MTPTLLISIVILALVAAFLYFVFAGKTNTVQSETDAKRFARLLISEIKLYENYKVEQGLKNNNLYESLRERIDEARKMYEKRIINSEHKRFFDEALIEVLANGDSSKFGQVNSSLN